VANNRLWLVHRPTGEKISLGKRLSGGWYTNTENNDLNEFYDRCYTGIFKGKDDFALVIEDAEFAPACVEKVSA